MQQNPASQIKKTPFEKMRWSPSGSQETGHLPSLEIPLHTGMAAVTRKQPMAEQGDRHLDLERAFGQSVIQPSHFRIQHLHIFLQFSPQSAQRSFRFSHFSLKNKLF